MRRFVRKDRVSGRVGEALVPILMLFLLTMSIQILQRFPDTVLFRVGVVSVVCVSLILASLLWPVTISTQAGMRWYRVGLGIMLLASSVVLGLALERAGKPAVPITATHASLIVATRFASYWLFVYATVASAQILDWAALSPGEKHTALSCVLLLGLLAFVGTLFSMIDRALLALMPPRFPSVFTGRVATVCSYLYLIQGVVTAASFWESKPSASRSDKGSRNTTPLAESHPEQE